MVSIGTIFAFTYMCAYFLHHIHPPSAFLGHLPHPTGTTLSPPCSTCSALLFSDFVEEKGKKNKRYFCLFEITVATQGVSL
jgi:tellurite resistance protein TehA-like permease